MKIHEAHPLRGGGTGIHWKLVSKTVLSGDVTTVDFTDLKHNQQYLLRIQNLVPTDNPVTFGIRCSTDNGATFDSGTVYAHWVEGSSIGFSTNNLNQQNQDNMKLNDDGAAHLTGNATDELMNWIIWMQGTGSEGRYQAGFNWLQAGIAATTTLLGFMGSGLYENSVQVNAIQLISSGASGLTGGTYRLYKRS